MFKLCVFVALLAVAVAAPQPGFLHHAVAYPVATSHSSRIDYHSKPVVVAAAPAIVHAPYVHAPIVKTYAAPIVKTIIPVSHSTYHGVHASPIISYGHHGGFYGGHGLGYGHGYGYGLGGYSHGLWGGHY